MTSETVWHDIECGGYREDVPLWREVADEHGDPVLDIGAGTGRITLALARDGHRVTALDQDSILLAELSRRAAGLPVTTVVADARDFDLQTRFPLCIVPMQTIQLLGGSAGRGRFLACAARHLRPRGLLAVAITDTLELFEVGDGMPGPVPDVAEHDGVVYSSQPTAVRAEPGGFVLERRRETISASGRRTVAEDVIRLDGVTADQLAREAAAAGFEAAGRKTVPATADYVGSIVVMLRG
jgi:SAM-dependent methyltransferase